MTDSDRQKQYTGFSIDAGGVGYLRASIGMSTENAVLRALFPEKFWDMTHEDFEKGGFPFDFMSEEDQRLLHRLAIQYFLAVLSGIPKAEKICGWPSWVRKYRSLGMGSSWQRRG